MTKDDIRLIDAIDLPAALGLLTRFPVQVDTTRAMARGAASAWAYPVVGAMLGTMLAAFAALLATFGVPATVNAGLVLGLAVVTTGAMHEDGLADSADGLWGGWDPARRLAIMKDSHIGVYGVCAVVLSLLIRWAALVALIGTGNHWMALIAAGALSRAGMVAVMTALPHARGGGLSHKVGHPSKTAAWLAVAIGFIVALACGLVGLLPAAILATLACFAIARAKIGGQTGDILGATQQVNEMAALVVAVAIMT